MIGAYGEYQKTIMSEDHWDALHASCEILIDEAFVDLSTLKD